ncbi:major intrinsically disordered Notch2-binding receptor 1 [Erinaceus europaeus]|uniref:Major intrinsically disordered Notch2-binding receptor 1 n=1 Tax=Erinaceus europaeus TaxID=9365 RepID=A0ABM3WG48_ERIEU|nr:major intrinsically disordered Notch2-binding receptor 1 [Erinaceus europaeus]
MPASQPDFLPGPGAKLRASSLDRLQALAPYGVGGARACEMQRTRFPTHPDSEPPSDPDSPPRGPQEPFPLAARPQRRGISSGGFPGPVPPSPGHLLLRGVPSVTHSFELPCCAPSPAPGPSRTKHESLDDLQASTYFGPPDARGPRQPPRHAARPAKSWSLNAEETPDHKRPACRRGASQEEPPRCPGPSAQTPSYLVAPLRPGPPEAPQDAQVASRPQKAFRDQGTGCLGAQLSSDTSSVGTQTEPPPRGVEPGHPRPHDGPGRRPSADSEDASEAISDIFRFLDELSLSGSTGLPPASCHASLGSLGPPLGSSGWCSPERPASPPQAPEDELRASVGQLVRRVGEVERRLEALAGVRREISQVLGRLQQLDHVARPPPTLSPQAGRLSSDVGAPRCTAHVERGASCHPDTGSHCGRPHTPAPGKSLPVRSCLHPLTTEPGQSSPPRDWRTITCPSHAARESWGPGDGKDWHHRVKEADRQYDTPPRHLPPREAFLVEQVFSPNARPSSLTVQLRGSPAYTDMRLTELSQVPRGPPCWSPEELSRHSGDKMKLAALDLQTQDSLNPNNVEYWMEDLYTPGYGSLLRHKEAKPRPHKACKMAALVAAAACTVVLVIVVPICTMKS